MRPIAWLARITFVALLALLSPLVARSGGAAFAPQGQQAFPYPKAFMLHRRAGGMPNLSVVGPLDVLRRKMMLDMMERRMKNKINANNEFLSRLGKRGGLSSSRSSAMLDSPSANVAALLNGGFQQEWLDSLDSAEV